MASPGLRLCCGLLAVAVLGGLTHVRGGMALDLPGHALFASLSAFALLGPSRPGETVEDSGRPSMRSIATALPVLFLLQILLGAACRYQHLGYMPHILGALAAALVAYLAGFFALTQFPGHQAIRRASLFLIAAITAQVLLGILALVERISSNGSVFPLVHLAAGALTLASGVVFALQIRRHVRTPRAAVSESRSALAQ